MITGAAKDVKRGKDTLTGVTAVGRRTWFI